MRISFSSFVGVGLIGAAALLSGCSKDTAKSIQQRAEEPSLMKTWEAKCGSVKVADLSGRNFYDFAGAKFKEAYFAYADDQCKTGSLEVLYQGDLTLGNKAESGLLKVDLAYKSVSVRPLNEDGQKLLEAAEACGIKTWPIEKFQDVTALEKKGICRLVGEVPSNDFNVALLENGKLYLGASGILEKRAQKEADRPDKVEREKEFQPSQNKLD